MTASMKTYFIASSFIVGFAVGAEFQMIDCTRELAYLVKGVPVPHKK